MIEATHILDQAKAIITGERQEQYGSPEDSFEHIAELWSSFLGQTLEARHVALLMILLKVARANNGAGEYKEDTAVDIAGYAACYGYLHNKQTKHEP